MTMTVLLFNVILPGTKFGKFHPQDPLNSPSPIQISGFAPVSNHVLARFCATRVLPDATF